LSNPSEIKIKGVMAYSKEKERRKNHAIIGGFFRDGKRLSIGEKKKALKFKAFFFSSFKEEER
jgi:hypothetical protein